MVSKLDIYNLAISTVGGNTLGSEDEDTHAGNMVRQFYPIVKERILQEHPWKCAVKRESLSESSSDPVFGWTNMFDLPDDCVRAIQVNHPADPFHVQGDKLLTDATTADLRYVYDVDEEDMVAYLVQCMQYALAVELANVLTQNVNLANNLYNMLYKQILPKAKHLSGMESYGDVFYAGFQDPEREYYGWH